MDIAMKFTEEETFHNEYYALAQQSIYLEHMIRIIMLWAAAQIPRKSQ